MEDGWFRTGDLGALDAEGNLYFKGRKKNVIVTSAGMNIYPEDLETALRREPEVKDCVVVGLERGGNAEPCGVLLLREGNERKTGARWTKCKTTTPRGWDCRSRECFSREYQRMRCWFLWPRPIFRARQRETETR